MEEELNKMLEANTEDIDDSEKHLKDLAAKRKSGKFTEADEKEEAQVRKNLVDLKEAEVQIKEELQRVANQKKGGKRRRRKTSKRKTRRRH